MSFAAGSTVKDTAELSLDDAQPQAVLGDTSWADVNTHSQAQAGFAESGVPVGGSDAFAGPYDTEIEPQGFRVKSTFEDQSPSVVHDFDQLDTPETSTPENVVSFDVDFSLLASPEPTVYAADPVQPEIIDLTPETPTSGESAGFAVPDEPTVPLSDGVSPVVGQTAILGSLEDPLGDVLAISSDSAGSEVVSTDSANTDQADFSAGQFAVEEPRAEEVPVAAAEPANESTVELLPPPEARDFAAEPVVDSASAEVTDAGWSYESSPTATTEPLPEVPAAAAETNYFDPDVTPQTGSGEQVSEPVFSSTVEPSDEQLWSDSDAKFAPIDIEAVVVSERAVVEDAAPLDGETGFAFAAVVDEVLEEPLDVRPAVEENIPVPPTQAFGAATNDVEFAEQQAAPLDLSNVTIDEIVRRVVAQLSDSVVREIAWEVVPDCVERVVSKLTEEAVSRKA
jgi:hypothetical protein